jgi:hypothetical protein
MLVFLRLKLSRQNWKGINCQAVIKFRQKETLQFEIHNLISIWNKQCPDQQKESIIVPIYKKGDKTECSIYCGTELLSTSYRLYPTSLFLNVPEMKFLGIISVGFNVTDQLLIKYLYSWDTGKRMWVQWQQYISYSWTSIKLMPTPPPTHTHTHTVQYSHRVWGTHETS